VLTQKTRGEAGRRAFSRDPVKITTAMGNDTRIVLDVDTVNLKTRGAFLACVEPFLFTLVD
jgi:hypothetical protein